MSQFDWGSKPSKVMSATAAAAVSIDPSLAPIYAYAPNEDETISATSVGNPGEELMFIFGPTPNTTSRTLTFNTAQFRSTGTLATGTTAARYFTIVFRSNGALWYEVSRTAAMA